MITPYLKRFNQDGGTLYVFPSVSKDLTRTFVSNDYEFKFSHFACLNLPDICLGKFDDVVIEDSDSDIDKGLYISTLMGQYAPNAWTNDKMENAISENLQNYVMNFETAILNSETYDNNILTTVSEKIFWNWLQKVGGIVFTDSGNSESFTSYRERTVQYIGDIDVMNTVEVNGDTFEELYIHIPSTAGASTSIYFRTGDLTDNKNYRDKEYPLGEDSEYIIGSQKRPTANDGEYTKIGGLVRKSFVDIDTGGNIYTGDIGHTIDFRDSSYSEGISNMNAQSLEDFEFNAILIYYDIFEKTSDPGVKRTATNLYGILFLDNVTAIAGSGSTKGYIQRYPKQKETYYENGNSYALKLDLKIDTIGDTEGSYYEIQDPNSAVSMTLYIKALEQLQKCIDLFYTQKTAIVELNDRISALENVVNGIDTITAIKEDLNRLNNLYDNYSIVDTPTLLGLIDENSKKLDSIIKGEKDIKLQYDTDVIQAGSGIGIVKSQNKVVINSEQKYFVNTVTDSSGNQISPDNRLDTSAKSKVCNTSLASGENLVVIYMEDRGDSTDNLTINVNSDEHEWVSGQSMKIYFTCSGGSFRFDSDSAMSIGVVLNLKSNVTLSISGYEFEGNDFIEVICIDENNFIYLIK